MSIIKINFNTNLKNDFYEYCKLNEIEDYEEFIQKCAKDGLSLDKYGIAPFLPKSQIQEVPVEKEVIKEVIKEIPVEWHQVKETSLHMLDIPVMFFDLIEIRKRVLN